MITSVGKQARFGPRAAGSGVNRRRRFGSIKLYTLSNRESICLNEVTRK
jgi:hypothetical protein